MKSKLDCILLVDDNKATNFFHENIIQKVDCANKIDMCYNGEEAIEYLLNHKESPPELIFLDINMPRMNGWEFLNEFEKIKDLIIGSPCIFIMLTTSINPDDQEKAKKYNILSGFQRKPLTKDVLEKILKESFPETFDLIG